MRSDRKEQLTAAIVAVIIVVAVDALATAGVLCDEGDPGSMCRSCSIEVQRASDVALLGSSFAMDCSTEPHSVRAAVVDVEKVY